MSHLSQPGLFPDVYDCVIIFLSATMTNRIDESLTGRRKKKQTRTEKINPGLWVYIELLKINSLFSTVLLQLLS